jgi:TP901 family phage tail tape measure protein
VVHIPGGKIDILVNPDFNGFEGSLRKGLSSASGIARTAAIGLGAAITAGTALAAVGFKKVIDLGMQYQDNLNELQAVSGATGAQMSKISQVAIQLGNDLSLPATSAADAASAMLALTKGGLSVDQAMTAAKGTLQLAAAASVDAATAAELQSKALNEFGLSAESAGHVADVLANTANAAAGSITDIGYALNYVGPVAKSFGISIDDTATALGLMANKGIQGESAGTSLRGVLASLARPSKEAAKALDELGVKAFDSQDKFVGLEAIVGQLAKAHGKLTQAQFESAAAAAFGNEGLTVANALAESGTQAFDDMAKSVSKQGGAADVAAAKMKGLGGALQGLQSQAETIALQIYQVISPALEALARDAQVQLGKLGDAFTTGLQAVAAQAQLYGPSIARAIKDKAGVLETAVEDLMKPLLSPAQGLAGHAFDAVVQAYKDLVDVLGNVKLAVEPVVHGIADIVTTANQGGGVISSLASGLGLVGDAARLAGSLLVPVGQAIGAIASLFAGLPGPVQTAVVALIAYKVAQKTLGDASIPVVSQLRQFSGEMKVQRELGLWYGRTLTTSGAAMAAFNTSTIPAIASARSFRDQVVAIKEGAAAGGTSVSTMSASISAMATRSPLIAAMKDSFEGAAKSTERFGTAAGIAAAAGTGLKGAASGLLSALGGVPGLIIGAATIGLGLLASSQQDAAEKTRAHTAAVDGLAGALRDTNGAIDENVRKTTAQQIQQDDSFKSARDLGVSLKDLTNIALGQGDALDSVRKHLQDIVTANTTTVEGVDRFGKATGETTTVIQAQGQAAQALLSQLGPLSGQYSEATSKNRDLTDAIRNGQVTLTASQQQIAALTAQLNGLPPGKEITVTTLSAEAEAALVTFGGHVTHLPNGQVTVSASTAQAQAAVDGFIRTNDGRRVTITVVGQSTQITVGSSTKAVTNGAIGGIVHAYAGGGIALNPMKGGIAQVVAPNTWRVIGDRVRDDEAYIPINASQRSNDLLAETASRMGWALMRRYAGGGMAGGNGTTAVAAPALPAGARITGNLNINGLDGYIDGRIDYANTATGSAIAQRSRN